jgi:hypothetical protein
VDICPFLSYFAFFLLTLLGPFAERKFKETPSSKSKKRQAYQLPESDGEDEEDEYESDGNGSMSFGTPSGSFAFAVESPASLAKLKEKNQLERRKNTKVDWQIGDRCEALWDDDQLYYKAVIYDIKEPEPTEAGGGSNNNSNSNNSNSKKALSEKEEKKRGTEQLKKRTYCLTFDDGQIGDGFTYDNMRLMDVCLLNN